jgi:hypothetical protein
MTHSSEHGQDRKESMPMILSKTLLSQTDLSSLKSLLEDIQDTYPDQQEDIKKFLQLIELFEAWSDFDQVSTNFLLEKNILHKYRYLNFLIYRFKAGISDEDSKRLSKVKKTIRDIAPIFSIETIQEHEIEEDSQEDIDLKSRIHTAHDALHTVSDHIEKRIFNSNHYFGDLENLGELNRKVLKAIKEAGGFLQAGGRINDISDYQNTLTEQQNNLKDFVKDQGFQPDIDIFARNKESKKEQKKEGEE